tara:strand:+ start:8294 stop:8815 length:522 start_codon:yes stop_codon:yes gene_type:complete
MPEPVYTLNLSDEADGMVPIDSNSRSNAFVAEDPKKNVSDYKDDMDSTPISDVMMQSQEQSFDSPLMGADPRAVQMAHQQVMMAPQPAQAATAIQESGKSDKKKKNPFDLTDEQLEALIVVLATGVAISKPIQEKLAGSVPRFLNAQGNRSLVGLASTGTVAAVVFYIARKYF